MTIYGKWLEHPDLAPTSPEEVTPAVNGLKIYNNFLYASNTQKKQIVKIPILPNGLATVYTQVEKPDLN